MKLEQFKEVWVLDFEFGEKDPNIPRPLCLVAKELNQNKKIRLWLDEQGGPDSPFKISGDVLLVAYFATAELSCFLELGWEFPEKLLDLYVEFRNLTNGLNPPLGNGLLGAMSFFGLSHIDSADKETMRELALEGGPYTPKEKTDLLDYCQSDVLATEALLEKMAGLVDIDRALIRGEYIKALSQIERRGISLDKKLFNELKEYWEEIQDLLIEEIDQDFNVFEDKTFKRERFEEYLNSEGISWPRLETGIIDLKDETFRAMSKIHPKISPLRELRHSLSKMRLNEFPVGSDGRSRVMLSPFRSKTGRNQPSNSRFIFGSSVWLRGLIKPVKGRGLAYIDWSQQEFGIAAGLSGDQKMISAYKSSDPYLSFAKLSGQVPEGATKQSHSKERSLFKATVLAVQFGMGAKSLSENISVPLEEAKHLLWLHKKTFSRFWEWSESCVDYALTSRKLWTTFGWRLNLSGRVNPRSLANFPMQANGAEMLRFAIIFMIKDGIEVCAPVHDAVLIEAPLEELNEKVKKAQNLMARASRLVLKDFELKTDAELIQYPERFNDQERGQVFWETVMRLLKKIKENKVSQIRA